MNDFAAPLPPPAKTPTIAIAAIVCSGLGLCCMPLGAVGIVLGIVSLVKHKQQSSLGKGLSIAALAIFPVTLVLSAAIAVPAFVKYVRAAKAAEAVANVRAIGEGVQRTYAASGQLPPSLPATPAEPPGDQKHEWPSSSAAGQGFAALGFTAPPWVYFVYSYERGADGQSFVVRANGDLDADGTLSTFTLAGHVEAGSVVLDQTHAAQDAAE